MKLGLTLPSFVDDPEIPLEIARRADAAGLDGVFVYDHVWRDDPPPRRGALECFALLGAVAAETERVHVGPFVARTTLRPPATLVAALDTLTRVSGGRVIAGLGAGDRVIRAENEAFGVPFGTIESRLGALTEATLAARDRGFPVWVAGDATRAGREITIADGWIGWGGNGETFARHGAHVRTVAPGATLVWAGLASIAPDAATAQRRAETRTRPLPPDCVAGDPDFVAGALAAYARAGADWVVVAPLDASNPDNVDVLAELVRPRLVAPA